MKRAISILNSPHLSSLGTGGPTHIPLEAFYVVQTTAGIVGASLQTSQENETLLS